MQKYFKKKKTIMHSQKKDEFENISIHRKRQRSFRRRLEARLRQLEKEKTKKSDQ